MLQLDLHKLMSLSMTFPVVFELSKLSDSQLLCLIAFPIVLAGLPFHLPDDTLMPLSPDRGRTIPDFGRAVPDSGRTCPVCGRASSLLPVHACSFVTSGPLLLFLSGVNFVSCCGRDTEGACDVTSDGTGSGTTVGVCFNIGDSRGESNVSYPVKINRPFFSKCICK